MLTVGSLFSGIGGLELGLEWAGPFVVRWQVESGFIEGDSPEQTTRLTEKNRAFLWSVLARHWPHARRYEDVRSVGQANLSPVDVIVGGFPCQDVSIAGKGAGLAGARSGLWGEFRRIVGELRPRYVVVENVSALLARGMGTVLGDLSALGYDAIWTTLRARDVGAPHERARIFIVAWLADASPRGCEPILRLLPAWQSDADGRGVDVVADADDAGLQEQRRALAGASPHPAAQRGGDVAHAEGSRLAEPGRVRHDLAGRGRLAADCGAQGVADPDGGRREGERIAQPAGEQGARGRVADRCGDSRQQSGAEDLVADASGERSGRGPNAADGGERLGTDARREQAADGPSRAREADVADADGARREGTGALAHQGRSGSAHGDPQGVADAERDPVRLEPERDQRQGRAVRAAERGEPELGDGGAARRRAAQRQVGRGPHGVPPRVDRWPSGPGIAQEAWEPPRATTRKDPYRKLRLRALGNAVMPQVAEVVGLLLLYIDALLARRAA